MKRATFIADEVVFEAAANTTHTPVRVKIPGKRGVIREIRVFIPTGNSGMTVDLAYTDNRAADLTDFDTLDPFAVRIFSTDDPYAGVSNPAGPKATPLVPDFSLLFGDNALFDAPNQDEHVIAIRTKLVTQAYKVRVQVICEIWRS